MHKAAHTVRLTPQSALVQAPAQAVLVRLLNEAAKALGLKVNIETISLKEVAAQTGVASSKGSVDVPAHVLATLVVGAEGEAALPKIIALYEQAAALSMTKPADAYVHHIEQVFADIAAALTLAGKGKDVDRPAIATGVLAAAFPSKSAAETKHKKPEVK